MAHYKGAASEAGRALQIQKKREREKEELELRKKKIEDELKLSKIGNKFTAHYDAIEAQLKSSTVGLVTLDEMKAKQEDLTREREKQLAQKTELQQQKELAEKNRQKEQQKKQIQTLSFRFDDEDEEGEGSEPRVQVKKEQTGESSSVLTEDSAPPEKKLKITKNPDVDTSFLPDRKREEEERMLREELRKEWEQRQERMKNEDIEITFSYWDGSGMFRHLIDL